jgi:hypothetical protein
MTTTSANTGPTADEIAEQVVRDLLGSDLADMPVLADFHRSRTPRVLHEYVISRSYDGCAHVELRPCAYEVIVGAYMPDLLGDRLVGEVEMVPYPTGGDGEVDVETLRGGAFRDRLAEVVRRKAAEAATAWGNR